MGQNIGTCVTAMLSSVGTNRNARRAAIVHLSFNVLGSVICLVAFWLAKVFLLPESFINAPANAASIATAHSVFNIVCTLLLLPLSGLLEKLAYRLVPDAQTKVPESVTLLDDRLLNTPAVALENCHAQVQHMAQRAVSSMRIAIGCLSNYTEAAAEQVRDIEDETDKYEDTIGTYLIKLSAHQLGDKDSAESAKYLKVIGDFERISDHAVNVVESFEELRNKGINLSDAAKKELSSLCQAVDEILELAQRAFVNSDLDAAKTVEPLEQVVDRLKEWVRTQHILRLQQGECSVEAGFVLSDLLTNLERTADHCSNIAGCVIDVHQSNMNLHESLRIAKTESNYYREQYEMFFEKYLSTIAAKG
jgi:phosphate:Na+ symporter